MLHWRNLVSISTVVHYLIISFNSLLVHAAGQMEKSFEKQLSKETEERGKLSMYLYSHVTWGLLKMLRKLNCLWCGSIQIEENEENDMHLPQSLIYRVRELAKKHPYPRQRGKKFAPAILPTESKGASSDLIIKYVRRKNRS